MRKNIRSSNNTEHGSMASWIHGSTDSILPFSSCLRRLFGVFWLLPMGGWRPSAGGLRGTLHTGDICSVKGSLVVEERRREGVYFLFTFLHGWRWVHWMWDISMEVQARRTKRGRGQRPLQRSRLRSSSVHPAFCFGRVTTLPCCDVGLRRG